MLRRRDDAPLVNWVERAATSLVSSFARGVVQDEAAVHAAIISKWSNGQTEGQVTRLKLVKRQMYGRGKIDLLEARLIGAPCREISEIASDPKLHAANHGTGCREDWSLSKSNKFIQSYRNEDLQYTNVKLDASTTKENSSYLYYCLRATLKIALEAIGVADTRKYEG